MSLKTFDVKWYTDKTGKIGLEVNKAQMGLKFRSPIDRMKSKLHRLIPEPTLKCLICQETFNCECRAKWPNIASDKIEIES